MALVKNPLMSAEARGSIGGITYSMSYAGPVCKIKAHPPTRMRSLQPHNRARLGWLARQWGGLTDAQRDSWEAWAEDHPEPDRFGGTFIMSGINALCKLNYQALRLISGKTLMSLPPEDPPAASLATLTVVTGATNPGEIDLTWTHNGTGDAADVNEIQIAGPFQSPGMVEVHSRYRYRQIVAGNVLTETVGSLDEGMWYWFRVRYVDLNGQTTAFLVGQATPKLTV